MIRPVAALALTVAAGAAAAGCGSSSGEPTSSAAKPSARPKAAVMRPKQAAFTVRIDNFKYLPAKITVASGKKLTWSNVDKTNHTVTSDKGSALNLGNLVAGGHGSVTLRKPGVYAYHCDYHPFMHGTVIVR